MTPAEIEVMLTALASTTRLLRNSNQRLRDLAEVMVEIAVGLQDISTRLDAAITASLTRLHGDEERDA